MPMNRRNTLSTRLIACALILFGTLIPCAHVSAQRVPGRGPGIAVPQPAKPSGPPVVKMRVEGDRITADITDCPLQKALKELADRTGIIFEVRTSDNPLVSVHLNQIPLQEAIQRIASCCNTMFFFGAGTSQSGPPSLVRILSRTPPVQQPAIVYLGSGVITKTGEDIETLEQAQKALDEGASPVQSRLRAVEFLVNAKSEAAIAALISSLNDPAPEIRAAAIRGLEVLGTHAALPDILKRLKDKNPEVRQSAATAVASLGDAKNLKDVKPLTSDKDAAVAAAAQLAVQKLSAAEKR
jgi:hypothetical protein